MKLIIEKSVTILTPTNGSPKLKDAILSVQKQTYGNLEHLIVVDGYEYEHQTNDAIRAAWREMPDGTERSTRSIVLPYNTGKTGGNFYGHRIYAAFPHLINSDYIFFLDNDNWYESDHVASLVEVLERGNDFAYSFRQIYEPDKTYVCHDNCEALGKWPIFFTYNKAEKQHLVDTSSFAFNTKFLQLTSHFWHHGWGGDRHYLHNALNYNPKWDTNYKHTLCYRLDGNPGSVNREFFIKGNEVQLENYNGVLPWLTKT